MEGFLNLHVPRFQPFTSLGTALVFWYRCHMARCGRVAGFGLQRRCLAIWRSYIICVMAVSGTAALGDVRSSRKREHVGCSKVWYLWALRCNYSAFVSKVFARLDHLERSL